jgi:hypothetical protein
MSEPKAPSPQPAAVSGPSAAKPEPRKGPLSFLSGALTSALLCVVSLRLSKGLAIYFALHPATSSSRIGQSIATALKTLLVGMSFLATFSFGFIALGLSLVFLKSLMPGATPAIADAATADTDQSP